MLRVRFGKSDRCGLVTVPPSVFSLFNSALERVGRSVVGLLTSSDDSVLYFLPFVVLPPSGDTTPGSLCLTLPFSVATVGLRFSRVPCTWSLAGCSLLPFLTEPVGLTGSVKVLFVLGPYVLPLDGLFVFTPTLLLLL